MSPFRRQELLVKRLTLNREHQRGKGIANRDSHTNADMPASRKRPFPSPVKSSAPSLRKIGPDMTEVVDCDHTINDIDEYETWEELTKILPLLTYGEESNDLLSALLDRSDNIDLRQIDRDGDGAKKCPKCNGKIAIANVQQMKQFLSRFTLVLDRMIRCRSIMRRRMHKSDAFESSFSLPKKQRLSKEEQKPPLAPKEASVEILPWNVLLRVTIRIASYVARQLHPSRDSQCCKCFTRVNTETPGIATNESRPKEAPSKPSPSTTMHPLLQVLDIVLADLHVLSRVQRQQQQKRDSELKPVKDILSNKVMRKKIPTTPTKLLPSQKNYQTLSRTIDQVQQMKSHLPRDRMMHDWKCTHQSRATRAVGREIWGPSRYAFLKDIESISAMLGMEENEAIVGINADEWQEKVDSIIAALDEIVRVELGNSLQQRDDERRQQQTLTISPSLRRYGNSPYKPASLASISRAHVERVRSRTKVERTSTWKESSSSPVPQKPISNIDVKGVNLMPMMDKESNDYSATVGDTDELTDAYRMAISFGSSDCGEKELVRETIERRLNLLVKKINGVDNHNAEVNSFNIDGAQSYLETLLRTLIKPSDPNVWLRLMDESRTKETPIMLRRGRSLLVCYLFGIKAPGWTEHVYDTLQSSPVPAYLGHLAASEEYEPLRKEQDSMNHRSSYFLPAVEVGGKLPPSPIVTEVGLSLSIKKFLHKDTSDGSAPIHQTSSSKSPGIRIFRNFGPLQSLDENDTLLRSIAAPLPDLNELTRDLFDLILRFAANDDSEHESKPFPLRLVTPSASESLNVVLQVASDHLEWLSPHSISSRYRFILQHIIQTFNCSEDHSVEKLTIGLGSVKDDFSSWSRRASFLIDVTTTANRGRMALYATQFMTLLCSGQRKNEQVFPGTIRQPYYYACLQLHQSGHFWKDLDKASHDFCSNIFSRVLDQNFCAGILLHISFQSGLLLARSCTILQTSTTPQSEGSQSMLSLVTILCSVLDLLASKGFLRGCVHIGWSIQMLLFSISHFVFGEDYHSRERNVGALSKCTAGSDSMWAFLASQLSRLYSDNWGTEWHTSDTQGQPHPSMATRKYLYRESIGNDTGSRMVLIMPSFDVFVANLIKFACNPQISMESNNLVGFCRFIAKKVCDRYAEMLQSPPYANHGFNTIAYSHQTEFFMMSNWIGILISSLQEMLFCQKASSSSNKPGKKRGEKEDDALTEEILSGLITPMLLNLHLQIMERAICSSIPICKSINDCSNSNTSPKLVASIFVDLHKQKVETFLKKPSPAKTRYWSLYRKCLEKVFGLTPPSVLFACPGCPALSEHSSNVLEDLWNQYGQWDLSHSTSIMVAAGLHVNTSASFLIPNTIVGRKDDFSLQLKELYNNFSSQAKSCIIQTYSCFIAKEPANSQKKTLTNFEDLVRFVRRELSTHREADVGLAWWNEISADLFSLLNKNSEQDDSNKSKRFASNNIAKAFLTLQNNLSAISGTKNTKNKDASAR